MERGVYPSRSQAVRAAIEAHLTRLDRGRLARECAKLDPTGEAAMAEEGIAADLRERPPGSRSTRKLRSGGYKAAAQSIMLDVNSALRFRVPYDRIV